ncbi:phytanoyl-CoA dioxygenase family protein [Cohnella silvisoli]|uniref:Phytanoyl-CoA dioxygenase family protein n=1 Tax=Cohnella silvisoli TaxID=2873699 RepID=A0ABV1L1I6_9BACL|nr:phytanoyl-CoA dioxygenase family protein [Cohnella silvisoli]MCD9025400.1 phytanoyl-CoA dioxygenase family protein [Cohnella silvisoli]
MLSKNRLGAAPKVYFRPEMVNCPHCGVKLRRFHTAWKKKISTLTGIIHAWSMAYLCPNTNCAHVGVAYKSAEAEMLSMKHSSYGYDVLCLVGELRFKQHRTCKEIADLLNERGIATRERYAQTLYERYQTLLAASLDDYVRQSLAETTAQHGGIILSMDGVESGFVGLSKEDAAALTPLSIEMDAGDVLCFNHMLPHRAASNQSDTVRWSMDIRFEKTTDATESGKAQGFVARSVADPASETSYPEWLKKWVGIDKGSY